MFSVFESFFRASLEREERPPGIAKVGVFTLRRLLYDCSARARGPDEPGGDPRGPGGEAQWPGGGSFVPCSHADGELRRRLNTLTHARSSASVAAAVASWSNQPIRATRAQMSGESAPYARVGSKCVRGRHDEVGR